MRRRESSPWSDKEMAAYSAIRLALDEEDIALVERYYAEKLPREKDFRRRDLLTLLNNWPGEVDRARGRFPHRTTASPATKPQPKGFREWLRAKYPEAREHDYYKVPDYVRDEFNRDN